MDYSEQNPLQLDSDGAVLSRTKVAPSGWSFQLRMFEIETSTLNSIVNNDVNGNPLTDCTLSLFDASGNPITDPTLQSTCVKTVVDFMPNYGYYVLGGNLKTASQPTVNIYANAIGAPDIPAASGGSIAFVQNVNMKYISPTAGVAADGGAAKYLPYTAYNTNKIRFQFIHSAGFQLQIGIYLEFYLGAA